MSTKSDIFEVVADSLRKVGIGGTSPDLGVGRDRRIVAEMYPERISVVMLFASPIYRRLRVFDLRIDDVDLEYQVDDWVTSYAHPLDQHRLFCLADEKFLDDLHMWVVMVCGEATQFVKYEYDRAVRAETAK